MKHSRFIILFLTIVTIGNFNYCAQQESARQSASRLTQESYISPEMQWAILSFLGAQDVTINTRSGNVAGIPLVNTLIDEVRRQLQGSIDFKTKESIKNALHAILEATDIAIFVAAVESAHKNQRYILYKDVDTELATALDLQKKELESILADLNARSVFDEPTTSSSYYSWFFPTIAEMDNPGYVPPLYFNPNQESITFSKDMMEAIIKKNNYKIEQKSDAKKAANILFKQCFIAQQHHLKDAARIEKFKINFNNPLTPDNYFFHNFPNIDDACNIVETIIPSYNTRASLEAPITQEQKVAHQLLLDIRQAIQTAMYIANDKSSYNVGYVLPTSIASYLGGIVIELTAYDTKLSELCKNPRFGATPDDTYRDEQWSTISKIAAGTITTAVIAGGIYFFGPVGAINAVTSGAGSLASSTGSLISNLWGGNQPTENSMSDENKKSLTQSTWEQFKGASETVYNAGSNVSAVAGGIAFATNLAQKADNKGMISLNELDPNARHYLDVANKVSTNTAVIGGGAMALGSVEKSITNAGIAYDTLKNSETISSGVVNTVKAGWKAGSVPSAVISAGMAANAAAGAGQSIAATAAQIAGIQNSFGVPNNQRLQTTPTYANQSPEELMFKGFSKVIADGITTEGVTPIQKIAKIAEKLLHDGMATPNSLIIVLQKLQDNNTQNNLLQQDLEQLKQAIINLQNQPLQIAQ